MQTTRRVYLDNQATTQCDPRVFDTMLPWFADAYGNPHSVEHAMGREAEGAVEVARARVAALIGAHANEIVFTSGATESNNIAIKGAARYALNSGNERRRGPAILDNSRSNRAADGSHGGIRGETLGTCE